MNLFDITDGAFPQSQLFSSENSLGNSNSSNFTSPPIKIESASYDSVLVRSMSFPKSYYNIPSPYNTFRLTENSTNVTITIPSGTYNKNNLLTVLASLLNSASPNSCTYAVSYSLPTVGDTFQFTFSVSNNSGVTSSFTMFSSYNSPYRQLGFDSGITYPFVNNVLVTPNAINLNYVSAIIIRSNLVTDNGGNLVTILNVANYPFMSSIYWQNPFPDMYIHKLQLGINQFNFSAEDEIGQPINTNGIPWITDTLLFQRANTHEIQKQELFIQNQEAMMKYAQQQDSILNNPLIAPIQTNNEIHYPQT